MKYDLNIIYRYPRPSRAQALNDANSAPEYRSYERAMRCLEQGEVPSLGETLHAQLVAKGRFEAKA